MFRSDRIFVHDSRLPPGHELGEKVHAMLQRLRRLDLFASTGATLLTFAPPHGLRDVLEDAAALRGDDRGCCVAREMTKEHEEIYQGIYCSNL